MLGKLLPIHHPKALRHKKQQQQRGKPLRLAYLNPQKPHLLRTSQSLRTPFCRFEPNLRTCVQALCPKS
jgi:hypothetical protein